MNTRSVLNISYYIYDQVFHVSFICSQNYFNLIYRWLAYNDTHIHTNWKSCIWLYLYTYTAMNPYHIMAIPMCISCCPPYGHLNLAYVCWVTETACWDVFITNIFSLRPCRTARKKICHQCKWSIPVIHTRTVWLLTYVALPAPHPVKGWLHTGLYVQ